MDWKSDYLWKCFADDYANITVDPFAAIPNDRWPVVRDIFRRRGVYVRKQSDVFIVEVLVEVVKEDVLWSTSERDSAEYSQITLYINLVREPEAGLDGECTRTDLQ